VDVRGGIAFRENISKAQSSCLDQSRSLKWEQVGAACKAGMTSEAAKTREATHALSEMESTPHIWKCVTNNFACTAQGGIRQIVTYAHGCVCQASARPRPNRSLIKHGEPSVIGALRCLMAHTIRNKAAIYSGYESRPRAPECYSPFPDLVGRRPKCGKAGCNLYLE